MKKQIRAKLLTCRLLVLVILFSLVFTTGFITDKGSSESKNSETIEKKEVLESNLEDEQGKNHEKNIENFINYRTQHMRIDGDSKIDLHTNPQRGYFVVDLVDAKNNSVESHTTKNHTTKNHSINTEEKKIMVEKKTSPNPSISKEVGSERYFYDLQPDKTRLPLQFGSGTYELTLLKNSEAQSYTVVDRQEVEVELKEDKYSFLNSSWPVYWENDMKAMELAKKLTEGSENDWEKVASIYSYIVENIDYDFDKINYIDNSYVPEIDETLAKKTGICYDYSALFAGMLRSVDIPTKLVKGYKENLDEYHAWNEVYLEEKDKWIIIDTTYDSALGKSLGDAREIKDHQIIKDFSEYEVKRFY